MHINTIVNKIVSMISYSLGLKRSIWVKRKTAPLANSLSLPDFETMSEATKLKIIQWVIEENDPDAIKRVKQLVDEIQYDQVSDSMVIGFRFNGGKVIKSDFLRCIAEAERGISSGEFVTLEELEKESENW